MYNKINYPLTQEVIDFLKNKDFTIEQKACYSNCFKSMYLLHLKYKNIKIAFCYVSLPFGLYCRHAVFTINGEIVDITLGNFSKDDRLKTTKYYIIKEITPNEYMNAVETNGLRADLPSLTGEAEYYCELKSKDITFSLIESEFFEYIVPKMTKKLSNKMKNLNEELENKLFEVYNRDH